MKGAGRDKLREQMELDMADAAQRLLLPAIEFSYFNPQTESYETVRSDPIIIQVTGDIAAGVTPLSPDGGAGATINTAVPTSAIPAFRPNKPASDLGHNSGAPLTGRVKSIGWGIAQDDGSTGFQLLPNVAPTFEWIRLAQRVPVRVRLEDVPADIHLVSGMTASVSVRE